ncbi:zinc finger and BTB domain-containing protein 182-like isoform X5 [Vespula squamosa]|uniref:Zinc finger and BTB domain-containing protein 182-like isoform X5 n=1 Tax=Vespula squamosa TaxID=30214 RepID=A0ABD2A2V5_VESSQ
MIYMMSGKKSEETRDERVRQTAEASVHLLPVQSDLQVLSSADTKYLLTGLKHTCGTCGKTYKHKHHLKRHHDFECGIDPKFKCDFCPHRTRYKDSLTKHLLARHQHLLEQNTQYSYLQRQSSSFDTGSTTGDFNSNQHLKSIFLHFWFTDTATTYNTSNWTVPTLPSTRCLRSMTMTNDNDRTTRLWGSRKYICNDCHNIFALKASLVRHKTFECNNKEQKDRQSSQKQNLVQSSSNSHSSTTTCHTSPSNTDKTISTNIIERKRSNRHPCPNCNRSYVFFTSLWRHQNYECGVEPQFICPICKAKFAQKSNLDRHVRTKH